MDVWQGSKYIFDSLLFISFYSSLWINSQVQKSPLDVDNKRKNSDQIIQIKWKSINFSLTEQN